VLAAHNWFADGGATPWLDCAVSASTLTPGAASR